MANSTPTKRLSTYLLDKLGIKVSSALFDVDINGSIRIRSSNKLYFGNSDATYDSYIYGDDSQLRLGGSGIQTYIENDLKIGTLTSSTSDTILVNSGSGVVGSRSLGSIAGDTEFSNLYLKLDGSNTMSGSISFTDSSRYWLRTASNWGIYWDTSSNQLKFYGNGNERFSVDLDNGNRKTYGTHYWGNVTATDSSWTQVVVRNSSTGYVSVRSKSNFVNDLDLSKGYRYSPGSSGGTRRWVKLFSLDGQAAGTGAAIEVLYGGTGDFGNKNRAHVHILAGQRDTATTPSVRVYMINQENVSDVPEIYYVSTGDYTFDVWAKVGDYNREQQLTILHQDNATIHFNSSTTTAPSGAVLVPTFSKWHSGNSNLSTVDWVAKDMTATAKVVTPRLEAKSNAPLVQWYQDDGVTDEKDWRAYADSHIWYLRAYKDDASAYNNALTITRSGITLTSFKFNGHEVFTTAYRPYADKWTTARTLTLNGDVSGSVSWDGSANVTMTTTVANNSHTHTWSNITSLPTITYTLSGDVTGSASVVLGSNVSLSTTVANDSHTHYLSAPYIQHSGYTFGTAGWYKVAHTNGGNHGTMILTIEGYASGRHGVAKFVITNRHGYNSITQIAGDMYGGSAEFDQIRVLYNSSDRIHGGAQVEIHTTYDNAVLYFVLEKNNITGYGNDWSLSFAAHSSDWVVDKTLTNVTIYSLNATDHPFALASSVNNYVKWIAKDGDGTTYDITASDTLQFAEGNGININFTADNVLTFNLQGLSGNWDAGNYEIRSNTFRSDVATGTAPFIVASTTKVSNLNVDLLDDLQASQFIRSDANDSASGNLTFTGEFKHTSNAQVAFGASGGRITPYNDGGHIELAGNTSSALLGVQDGNGRIQLKWNATAGTSETFLVGGEHAAFWQFDTMSYTNRLFKIQYADGSSVNAGDTISWQTIFEIGTSYFRYIGNDVWHAGNDGSGSGLDADLLDGHHWSDVVDGVSIPSGRVAYGNANGDGLTSSSGLTYTTTDNTFTSGSWSLSGNTIKHDGDIVFASVASHVYVNYANLAALALIAETVISMNVNGVTMGYAASGTDEAILQPTTDLKVSLGKSTNRFKVFYLNPDISTSTSDDILVIESDGYVGKRTVSDVISNGSYWSRSGSNTYLKNSADNVGIGTASPSYKLDVIGRIQSDAIAEGYRVLSYDISSANQWTKLGTATVVNDTHSYSIYINIRHANARTSPYMHDIQGRVWYANGYKAYQIDLGTYYLPSHAKFGYVVVDDTADVRTIDIYVKYNYYSDLQIKSLVNESSGTFTRDTTSSVTNTEPTGIVYFTEHQIMHSGNAEDMDIFVPYVGATQNVDLGVYDIKTATYDIIVGDYIRIGGGSKVDSGQNHAILIGDDCGIPSGSTGSMLYSIAIGQYAMQTTTYNSSFYGTVAIGNSALKDISSGGNACLIFGGAAGQGSDLTTYIAIGLSSAQSATGTGGISIGYNSGRNSYSSSSILIGSSAGYMSTKPAATIDRLIGLGYETLKDNTAEDVIAIGYQAGKDNTINKKFILQQTNLNTIPLLYGDIETNQLSVNSNIINGSYTLYVNGTAYINGNLTSTSITPTNLTTGYIPYKSSTTLVDSALYTDGYSVAIGDTQFYGYDFFVNGDVRFMGSLNVTGRITAFLDTSTSDSVVVETNGMLDKRDIQSLISDYGYWSRNGTDGYVYLHTITDKVGIGTTDPGSYRLKVVGGNGVQSAYFALNSDSTSEFVIDSLMHGEIAFRVNDQDMYVLISENNGYTVGIGTDAPDYFFTIKHSSTSPLMSITQDAYTDKTVKVRFESAYSAGEYCSAVLGWKSNSSNNGYFFMETPENNDPKFYFSSNGNLSVNTSSLNTSYSLYVNGTNNKTAYFRMDDGNVDEFVIHSSVDDVNAFRINDSDKYILLDESGNFHVGIGVTTPTNTLDINGEIRIRGGNPGVGKVLMSNAVGEGSWVSVENAGGVPSTRTITLSSSTATPILINGGSTLTQDLSADRTWSIEHNAINSIPVDGLNNSGLTTPTTTLSSNGIIITGILFDGYGHVSGYRYSQLPNVGLWYVAGDMLYPEDEDGNISVASAYYIDDKKVLAIPHIDSLGVGVNVLSSISTDYIGAVAVGYNALNALTSGAGNVAVGYEAGIDMTTASHVTAIGSGAAHKITTGDDNTVVGNSALFLNTVSAGNIAVGGSTLYSYNTTTSGDGYNVALGFETLYLITSGKNNIGIGYQAGRYNLGSGSNNILIGSGAEPGSTANSSYTNSIVIGGKWDNSGTEDVTEGHGSNTTTIGNGNTTDTYLRGKLHVDNGSNTLERVPTVNEAHDSTTGHELRFARMTQTDYDNLSAKDDDTIYFII